MSSKAEEAPPSYAEARKKPVRKPTLEERRSMEDLAAPLPDGWIRQFDPSSAHHYYVNTKANPPLSTWDHPNSASASTSADDPSHLVYESTDEDDHLAPVGAGGVRSGAAGQQQSTQSTKPPPTGLKKLGQSVKDKLTSSTHAERVAARRKRDERERQMYEEHLMIQQAVRRAAETGQAQKLGVDAQGREVWVRPPPPGGMGMGYGYGGGMGGGMYGGGMGGGMYGPPVGPYGRRGMGMGGGMGMPMMGGLAGGMLLGGLLF